jgi:DNA-binding CsgD family transcriptional regulator
MPAELLEPLTLRQLQLLVHVANGLSAEEIADAEKISPSTVRNTLHSAKERAGARNLPHLVAIVVSCGLIAHQDDVADGQE